MSRTDTYDPAIHGTRTEWRRAMGANQQCNKPKAANGHDPGTAPLQLVAGSSVSISPEPEAARRADATPLDEVLLWQGRIAKAVHDGGGLDTFQEALTWIKANVTPENALLEKAKQDICGAAEGHLIPKYGDELVAAIYRTAFPEDTVDDDLDQVTAENDAINEIARLAKLSTIKYHLERKAAAEDLGINVKALDEAVKEARKEGGDTKGQGRALSLPEPEPWTEPVDGEVLVSGLVSALRTYMVMDENELITTALWVLHCHAIEAFTITPRLAITSPEKGCGKTTLLDILGALAPRTLQTANTSVAPIFRAIELVRPTLLIDEGDTFINNSDDLRGILNSGHRKGGNVLRTVGEDHEPRQFSTWAPVAIAMIGKLTETLADRSISIRLRRKRDGEVVEAFRLDRPNGLGVMARKAARWTADNLISISTVDPPMPAKLHNRALDNWAPLVGIADQIGGEWPRKVRKIAEAMAAADDDASIGVKLLADIRDAFDAKGDRLSSEELVTFLTELDDRPWSEWKNGKPMTKAALGRQLSKFGISSENIKVGTRVPKGYHRHRFEDAFSRYTPFETATPLQPNNDGHFSQNQNATTPPTIAFSKCEKPLQHSDNSGVALLKTPHSDDDDEWADL